LKPEQWGSPLVQEKYQEEKACDKSHPYRIVVVVVVIIIIIIIIIIISGHHFFSAPQNADASWPYLFHLQRTAYSQTAETSCITKHTTLTAHQEWNFPIFLFQIPADTSAKISKREPLFHTESSFQG